jgi:hypothetical protein
MSEAAIDVLERACLDLQMDLDDIKRERDALAINLQVALAQLQLLRVDRRYEVSTPSRVQ